MNVIPPITDPLGKHWQQPAVKDITLSDTHALMSQANFDLLREYSSSVPSGTYDGKMWKSQYGPNTWHLCWYGPHPQSSTLIAINRREIVVV